MKFSVLLVTAAFVLNGCGRGEEDVADSVVDEYNITADTAIGYSTDLPAPVTPVPDVGTGLLATGNLAEVNNSGITGGVSLAETESGTRLYLNVSGAQPNVTLEAGIHEGDCSGVPGERITDPVQFEVNDEGIATDTSTVPVPAAVVLDRLHSVQVYTVAAGEPTPPVACADLPDEVPTPGSPPA